MARARTAVEQRLPPLVEVELAHEHGHPRTRSSLPARDRDVVV